MLCLGAGAPHVWSCCVGVMVGTMIIEPLVFVAVCFLVSLLHTHTHPHTHTVTLFVLKFDPKCGTGLRGVIRVISTGY